MFISCLLWPSHCRTFQSREELNFFHQRTQQNFILTFPGSSCLSYRASRRHMLRCFLPCREVSLKGEEKNPGADPDSPCSSSCACGPWLVSTSSLRSWPSWRAQMTLQRGGSWSPGAPTGFFRSQESWEPPGMHFTASKEWASSLQSESPLFPSLSSKKRRALNLWQAPSFLEKVVSTNAPFPLPTAVLPGCAGQCLL